MLVLQQAVKLTENTNLNKSAVRFAAICHDLGKALTPKEMWQVIMVMKSEGLNQTRSLCRDAYRVLIIFKISQINL